MYLKTLTLRGFKSFASATRLELEPGITCVVGPNGSGKSNVVDALAWVMGEQGAKNLRGGKMDDVIFAGTSNRQALGRAQVTLTIDNTDGAIPIDYTEVTISRTLFRTGGSEYAVNGEQARLLDIQELLNDSGLGKEMHVIVGQGRLDQILHADPLERRSFIEEAAGVLKHRRRKDTALRKLTGLQTNLDRLSDLRAELSGQLGPLGRQARAARRAARVQAVVRDTRARLLADDVVRVQARLESGTDTAAHAARLETARARAAELDRRIAQAQAELSDQETLTDRLAGTARRFAAHAARSRSLAQRAEDRVTYLHDPVSAPVLGDPPEALENRAKHYEEELEAAKATHAERAAQVDALEADRGEAQRALTRLDEALRAQRAQAAGRVRQRARLEHERDQAARATSEAEAEISSLGDESGALDAQHALATRRLEAATAGAHESEGVEAELDEAYERASTVLESAEDRLADLDARLADVSAELSRVGARAEALDLGTRLPASTAELLDRGVPGVLDALGELIEIAPGAEQAVTAALGTASAVVAEDLTAALALLGGLDADTALDVVVAAPVRAERAADAPEWPPVPATGGQPVAARALVAARRPELHATLDALLEGAHVCADSAQAASLLAEPAAAGRTYVTLAGEVVAPTRVSRSRNEEGARLEARAALEETAARAEALREDARRLEAERPALVAERDAAQQTADDAMAALHESDARILAAGQEVSGAAAEIARIEERRADLGRRMEKVRQRQERAAQALERATAGLADAAAGGDGEAEPDTAERDAQAARIADLGESLMEARIALRSAHDRTAFLDDRIKALRRQAEEARAAREAAARESAERRERAEQAAGIAERAADAAEMFERLERLADGRLAAAKEHRAALAAGVEELREEQRGAAETVAELTEEENAARLVRERHRLALEELERRAAEQTGLSIAHLVEQFGPHLPVPVLDADDADAPAAEPDAERTDGEPRSVPFDRSRLEKECKRAERDLKSIGTVNPLALEEYEALKERHDFLERQINDIEGSRRDLMGLVREVDRHVEEVFASAYADTAEQFARIFSRLFPGGEGSLTLTDPDDMLATGVEVHARPAGKKVKRLSLLSGGERSLVAVALLVAIFKARPSPFYVMDEVEAALDDVNLQRLLTVFQELQEASQLIVITHQKRTMEIADALYGVTMGSDGVSQVISQRLVHRTEGGQDEAGDGAPDAGGLPEGTDETPGTAVR